MSGVVGTVRPRSAELREFDLGPASLSYARWTGDAAVRPVVFLHPWFGCWQFWSATAEVLGRTCYAPDLYSLARGSWHGWADPDGLARAVSGLLDVIDAPAISLVGNSVGGIVAQAIAAAQPDRVADLVLIGTGATTQGGKPEFRARADAWIQGACPRGAELRSQVEDIQRLLIVDPVEPVDWDTYAAMVCTTDQDYVASVLRGATRLDLRSRLDRISARTLVVRGEFDAARTADQACELAAGITGSVAVELPGRGHCPMIEDPAGFTTLLRAFLDGQAPP